MSKNMFFLSITLGIFAVLTATLLSPTKTYAWAELSEPAYTFDIATKTDEQTASGTYAEMSNWRDRNYAVYEYNNGSNTGTVIMAVWDLSGSRAGSISDGGPNFTSIYAAFLCRWTMDGSYLYGCQWGGVLSADHVFNVHLTEEYIDAQDPDTWTPPDGYLGGGSGIHLTLKTTTPEVSTVGRGLLVFGNRGFRSRWIPVPSELFRGHDKSARRVDCEPHHAQ